MLATFTSPLIASIVGPLLPGPGKPKEGVQRAGSRIVQETVDAAGVLIKPNNLAQVVDAVSTRVVIGEGIVESNIRVTGEEEPMANVRVIVVPDIIVSALSAFLPNPELPL